jgi:hypothetical protein
MTEAYDGRQVVGMDLHRRRSVLARMTGDGRKLETVRIENSPQALRAVLARAGRTRSFTSFQATVRVRLSQQSRAGASDEPGPVICAAERVLR